MSDSNLIKLLEIDSVINKFVGRRRTIKLLVVRVCDIICKQRNSKFKLDIYIKTENKNIKNTQNY